MSSEDSQNHDETNSDGKEFKYFHKFSVQFPKDPHRCKVNRMAAISDGRVVVIDIINHRLKLFSEDFIPSASVELPVLCCAVTVVGATTVAVAGGNVILQVEVGEEELTILEKVINIDFHLCDFTRLGNKYVCLGRLEESPYLFLTEENGDSKEIVKLPAGELTFSDSLTTDDSGQHIYVNDDYSGDFHIACYSLKGVLKWKLKTQWMPSCLIFHAGRLLVTEYACHTIHHVTKDGVEVDSLVLTEEDEVRYPHALIFQAAQQRLLISSRKHNQEIVTVFSKTE